MSSTNERPNSLVDLDENFIKRLRDLPVYEGRKDSEYSEVHRLNLDIWRTLGLASAITWMRIALRR